MSSIPPRAPHLLRFGLRQMFFFVTLLCVLMSAMVLTEGPWPLAIGATSLLVAAHVFGTLIGNRLRDSSQEVIAWRAANSASDDKVPQANLPLSKAEKSALPPPSPLTTPLAEHSHVCTWLLWFVLGGAVLGTVLGGTILGLTIGSRIGWAGWAVGAISCGVLGTWTAFLASSFGSIARHAWRDASEGGK